MNQKNDLKNLNYPNIASQVFGVPLLATPDLLNNIKQVLLPRMIGGGSSNITINQSSLETAQSTQSNKDVNQFENKPHVNLQVNNGVAVINVNGILATRRGTITAACSEMLSYEYLLMQYEAALESDDVIEIVFDMNSHGGAALGCFEFTDKLFSYRGAKPTTAIINYSSYSAAYAIAAACDNIIISQSGGVGSIGVIAEHAEYSQAIKEAGWVFTTVYRGAHKNDLTPHEPITDQALLKLNESVDEYYQMFVDGVARYRGMKVADVIATEAATYRGTKAIDAGLADALMTPSDAINSIAARVTKRRKLKTMQAVV